MLITRAAGCALAFATLILSTGAAMPAAQDTQVHVSVTDLRSSKGVVRACLTANPDAFPQCDKDPDAARMVVKARSGAEFRFEDVAPGRYAIAVLHDENANGKADRAITMIPKEGFGFSRDAKVRFGPPKFDDAAFTVDNASRDMPIRMRYIL